MNKPNFLNLLGGIVCISIALFEILTGSPLEIVLISAFLGIANLFVYRWDLTHA